MALTINYVFVFRIKERRSLLMRFLIAGLILAVTLPGTQAKNNNPRCNDNCSSQYQLCLGHATTSRARNICKTAHKNCKRQCR